MTKKRFRVSTLAALALCIALIVALTSCALIPKADAAGNTFVKESTLKIGHITDTHYYPLNYCFPGGTTENALRGTDYEDALMAATKVLPENSIINAKAIKMMESSDMDYLVVTGDLTFDGEIQAHIELANLLRRLQNRLREKNPDFQVFVIPGNHDMYNISTNYYKDDGIRKTTTHLTTRKDITKIYSSLGYPDLTDAEIEEYYDSITVNERSGVYYDHLPYDGNYVNSTTAATVSIKWQYQEMAESASISGDTDYQNGYITYVATLKDENAIVAIDEEISDAEVFHYVGGKLYQSSIDFLNGEKEAGTFNGRHIYGILHHNAVPHFKQEDSLLKDFPLYGWRESLDFFTNLGIDFVFSGHMHSNDIATAEAFSTGKRITDIETAAVIGHKGGVRYNTFERGKFGSDDAVNFYTRLELVGEIDVTTLITEGYIDQHYIDYNELENYISKRDGRTYITDTSEYLVHKMFYTIIEMLEFKFLDPDFIANVGSMIEAPLSASDNPIIKNVGAIAKEAVNAIIVHLEDSVLKDYTYSGNVLKYKEKKRGAKLAGFASELIRNAAINLKVTDDGSLNLFDFGMAQYIKHLSGTDKPYEKLTDAEKEALENFKNGKVVKDLVDILLDKNSGLYKLVEGLTMPIDFESNMSAENLSALKGLLTLISPSGFTLDTKAVVLDNHLGPALDLLGGFISLDIPLKGKTIMGFVDEILDSYVTTSLYTSLGEIAHDILYAFGVDETGETEISFTATPVLYKYDLELPTTYLASAAKEEPSVDNGKLPSMLTVTFGADAKTDKNFVWFTDPRITDGVIEYMEGEFNSTSATKKTATSEIWQTTTASIDLGIFATNMYTEKSRHSIELIGLEAGKTYSYRVGSPSKNFYSPVYTFKTAPDAESTFDLLLLTDLQGSAKAVYDQTNKILSNMSSTFANGYDFMINCGDMVDNAKNLVQWEYFLDTLQGHLGNTTQVVAAGNHESQVFKAPEKAKDKYPLMHDDAKSEAYNYFDFHYNYMKSGESVGGTYYSFDYSGVHFTVLNTNDFNDEKELNADQIAWLIDDLTSTDKKFKVVLMHKGPYTAGSHSEDGDVKFLRQTLTPIFAEHKVNLVLQGHDHTYSESYYLNEDGEKIKTSAQGKTQIGTEGTLYVTLGTLGDKYYKYVENEEVPIEFGKALHKPTLKHPTFGKLSFDGENLFYEGFQYNTDTDKIVSVRSIGLLWWHYLLIAGGAVLVVVSITVITVSIKRNRKAKKATK